MTTWKDFYRRDERPTITKPFYSARKQDEISATMLTRENYDAECGRYCPSCGFWLQSKESSTLWVPCAVVAAPWTGGVDRNKAIVKECPECFELTWFHASERYLDVILEKIKNHNENQTTKAEQ